MENYIGPDYIAGAWERGGGGRGVVRPSFLGADFIHFLYKVLGSRSVQKEPFNKINI